MKSTTCREIWTHSKLKKKKEKKKKKGDEDRSVLDDVDHLDMETCSAGRTGCSGESLLFKDFT